jgi:hypothetical protein
MNVDRARFLLLTTALAAASAVAVSASGCTVQPSEKDTNSSSGNVPTDSGGGADAADAATDGYYADGASEDGGSCLTDDGIAPTCEGILSADCATACNQYVTNYKKGVGRAIVECVGKLATCVGAENAIAACVQGALAKACADPSAATYCDPLATSCNADSGSTPVLDKGECTDLATGLNQAGRDAFTSCVTEGTAGYCKSDAYVCIDLIQ